MKKLLSFLKKNKYEFIVMAFVFAYLYPVLHSGFYYDDSINALTHGAKVNGGAKIIDMVLGEAGAWYSGGRVFPLGPFNYYLFDFISYTGNPALTYKIYIVLMTLINIWLFGILVEKISRSKRLKLIVMLIMPAFFQIAVQTNNALYSFHALLQSVFMFGLLSVICTVLFYEKKRKIYPALSAFFMACSMLLYEVGFLFILPVCFVSFHYKDIPFSARVKTILPQISIYLFIVSLNVYARLTAVIPTYDGVTFNLESTAILKTFLKQLSAAVPLTQAIFNGVDMAKVNSAFYFQQVICLPLFAVLGYFIIYKMDNQNELLCRRQSRLLVLIGLALILVPCVLISLSKRYQNNIHIGAGHLPVYAEWLGAAVITAVIFMTIDKAIRKRLAAYLLFIGVGLPIIFININTMNAFFNETYSYTAVSRAVYQNAIRNGFYDEVTENDMLVYDNSTTFYAVPTENMFATYADRKMHAKDIVTYLEEIKDDVADFNESANKPYFTKEIMYNDNGGVVLKGILTGALVDSADSSKTRIFLSDVELYVDMKGEEAEKIMSYFDYSDIEHYTERKITLDLKDIAEKGHVIQIDSGGCIDLNSISIQ